MACSVPHGSTVFMMLFMKSHNVYLLSLESETETERQTESDTFTAASSHVLCLMCEIQHVNLRACGSGHTVFSPVTPHSNIYEKGKFPNRNAVTSTKNKRTDVALFSSLFVSHPSHPHPTPSPPQLALCLNLYFRTKNEPCLK